MALGVVPAGSGNDVAAALRAGVGHVDAVDIDREILAGNPAVDAIVRGEFEYTCAGLARALGLTGFVTTTSAGVVVEAEDRALIRRPRRFAALRACRPGGERPQAVGDHRLTCVRTLSRSFLWYATCFLLASGRDNPYT